MQAKLLFRCGRERCKVWRCSGGTRAGGKLGALGLQPFDRLLVALRHCRELLADALVNLYELGESALENSPNITME